MPAIANPGPPSAAPELPVDAATLYPEGEGFFARRAGKRRAKLLAGLADLLRRALAPGEVVRWAARGVRYHIAEHVFGGAAVAQYHNMTALVLTDRRLLLVQVGRSGRPADIKNEVPLAAIHGVKKGLGGFTLLLADGAKLRYVSMPGADRKRLRELLPSGGGPRSAEPSVVHLCPVCLRAVPGPVGAAAACPHPDCRIPFRDPRRAARLSALVPGLGDLYLRHHFFGSLEFVGSMVMLGLGLGFLVQAALARNPASMAAGGLLALLVIGVPRVVDWRLTLHMGKKGIVPLALAPAPGGQVRNLPSYPRWSPLLFVAGIALTSGIAFLLAQDLGKEDAVGEAAELAAAGRLDEARARWDAIERRGDASEARRVKFALALLEAGDLEGAGALEEGFQGTKIDAGLARRWNAASQKERAALDAYKEGVQALVQGDASAWARIDPSLAYFRNVKRPHLPASRGELNAHLAEGALAEPLAAADVDRARRWLEALEGAPAAEVAAVRAAYRSVTGSPAEARGALGGLDRASLSPRFQLLALEASARIAQGDAERAAVRDLAAAFPRAALDEEGEKRLRAAIARVK